MTKLIQISGKDFCKILEKLGFEKTFGKGSHVRFKHSDGRKTVVTIHGTEKLGKGLLRTILNQIDLSKEDYEKLSKEEDYLRDVMCLLYNIAVNNDVFRVSPAANRFSLSPFDVNSLLKKI